MSSLGLSSGPVACKLQNIFKETQKKCLCFHFPTKASDFSECGIWTTEGRGKLLRGSESIRSPRTGRGKRGMERWWKSKNPTRPKTGMKACLDLWYMVFFFFFSSLPFFHPHTYTWESRQLMCCLWWQREAYINGQKDHDERAEEKEAKWVENVLLERMATHDEYLGWSDGNQTSGSWGFDDLTAAEERLR